MLLYCLVFYPTLLLAQGNDPSTRARALVAQMTNEEKYSLLNGIESFADNYYVGNTPAIPRLGIPSLNLHDGPQGFRTTDPPMYGQVTSWPCSLAVASTWDAELMNKWAVTMGVELRAKGGNVILGPGLNFHRVARNGRNAEYLTGEDPYFGSIMTTAYIKGVQSQKVIANMKHFALNNQETNRHTESSNVDERTLWEIYYPMYEAGVKAGVGSVMCAYNLINGTYACGNAKNLNDDLHGVMGFEGWVLSDWYATHGLYCEAGLDQDMPGDDGFYDPDQLATVNPTTINNMVYRILLSFITSGAFDDPVCNTGPSNDCSYYLYNVTATTPEHVNLARSIAAESAQLLQNNGNVLPLINSLPPGATIAIVGSACNSSNDIDAMTQDWQLGNYYVAGGSGRVLSPYTIPILQGIINRAAHSGYHVIYDGSDNVASSINLIKGANIGIICGGTTCTEDIDRSNLLLDNDAFIGNILSVTSTNSSIKTVVLMSTPGTILTNWRANTSAIINMFLAGQETGNAWADVLWGDVNPSGKLPLTLPLSDADTIQPCLDTQCPYSEGLFVGYRGLHNKAVAFPFGHGLSYTNFDLAWERLPTTACAVGYYVCMDVAVKNYGAYNGATVVQVYLDYPTTAGEPLNLLRGFKKRFLNVDSEVILNFGLTQRDVSVYNMTSKGWSVVTGIYTVHVGFSSRDQPLQAQITIS